VLKLAKACGLAQHCYVLRGQARLTFELCHMEFEQKIIMNRGSDAISPSLDTKAQLDATTEILHLIGASRHDEQPIFEAILKHSLALCNAQMAGVILATEQDDHQRLAAHEGLVPAAVDLFESGQMKMGAKIRIVLGGSTGAQARKSLRPGATLLCSSRASAVNL
jgi:hypothetical protein